MAKLWGAKYVPIKRIDHGKRGTTEFVVVHDMESDSLDGVQSYFATSSPDAVGAHIGIGVNGEVREWADLDTLVYHAVGGNTHGVGIELCGFASSPRIKWIQRRKQRISLAKAIARICHHYNLGLPTHGTNVLGHYQLPEGGHVDPGKGFPWDAVMRLARKYYREFYPKG